MITTVTITGADEGVNPLTLVELSKKYPFVEWGILASSKRMGSPRYPDVPWMTEFARVRKENGPDKVNISLHLCGKFVGEVCRGEFTVVYDVLGSRATAMFRRVQLNGVFPMNQEQYHGLERSIHNWYTKRFILQAGDVDYLSCLDTAHRLNAEVLFDCSGGKGVLPEEWPVYLESYIPGVRCGYAGGLSPENIAEQAPKIIKAAAGNEIWIDCESGVRTDDVFDLDKVEAFLEAVKPFANGGGK